MVCSGRGVPPKACPAAPLPPLLTGGQSVQVYRVINLEVIVMMDMNCFLVDWLSFRCDYMSWENMIDYLGLHSAQWSHSVGFYGYRFRKWCSGISIHYENPDVDGVLVEISGTGCRALETFSKKLRCSPEGEIVVDWMTIFEDILDDPGFHVTRLDVAFDDKTGCIPLDRLFNDIMAGNFVSRFKSSSMQLVAHPGNIGQTVYLGSAQSDVRFRIYDKAFERGLTSSNSNASISSSAAVSDTPEHWVRFEMQLRRERALSFIAQLVECDYDISTLFSSVVNNYFRIVVPDESDSNKRRWAVADYWAELMDNFMRVSLWVNKDLEYNKSACERYVYRMAGNSIFALIEIEGLERFFEMVKKNKSKIMPKRIEHMLSTELALKKARAAA